MLVKKPWGEEEIFYKMNNIQVKMIRVNANSRLSLQKHMHKKELMLLVKGQATLQVNNEEMRMNKNQYFIHVLTLHRISTENEPAEILEVSQDGDDDDIIRISDDYGRADESAN